MPDAPSQIEMDRVFTAVFGVQGQGGILREMEQLRIEVRRQSRTIFYGAMTMATSLVGLAIAVIQAHG